MKRSCFRVVAFTLSIVVSCSALGASGQTATGSLSGMVTDLMGIALPNAKVRVTQTSDRRTSFETRTDDRGCDLVISKDLDLHFCISLGGQPTQVSRGDYWRDDAHGLC